MRALFKFYIVLFSVLSLTFSVRAIDNSFFSRFRDRKSPSFNREELRPLGQWKFSPMVTRDATIVIGVNLDKHLAVKIFDDQVGKTLALLKVGVGKFDDKEVEETRRRLSGLKRDPFKNAPPELREFLGRSGLCGMDLRWAVLSLVGSRGSVIQADPWHSVSLALAGKINLERLFSVVAKMSKEHSGDAVTFKTMTVAGEKAWREVRRGQKMEEDGIGLHVTMLDDQLLLLAFTRETLARQILLYREGLCKGDALGSFSPEDGDALRLYISDVGKSVQQEFPRDLTAPYMPFLEDLDTLRFDVRVSSDGMVHQTLFFEAKSEENAGQLRKRMSEGLEKLRTEMQSDSGVPQVAAKMIDAIEIRKAARGIKVFHADVLSYFTAALIKGDRRTFAKQPRDKKKVRKNVRAKRPAPPVPSAEKDDDNDDGLTSEERALSKRIEAALDEDDLAKAVACAKEALASPNAEIRQTMVDTLGWFGEKGLPQLVPFLADPDKDVRDSAMDVWSEALSAIEDEPEKLGIVELAMNVLTDEEALEDIADEYVGADEKLAVESLLRIIEGGGSKEGIAKAKETYEFVTGDEFTDRAAAEKWIAEEYVPDEDSKQEQMK